MAKRSTLRSLVFLLIIGAVTAGLIYYLMSTRPSPPVKEPEEASWLVSAETLEAVSVSPQIVLLATTESNGLARISSRINADVLETPFLAGLRVAKGDILLILDPTEAQANLSQREADVAEFQARISEEKQRHKADTDALKREKNLVTLTEKSVERQRKLTQNKVSSQERLESAEIALERQRLALNTRNLAIQNHPNRLAQLQAQLNRAQSLLEVARKDFAQTRLAAPFDGRVTALHTAPGNRVLIGEPLIELLAEDSLEVVAQVPNRWANLLRSAMSKEQSIKAYPNNASGRNTLTLERLGAQSNAQMAGINAYFHADTDADLVLGNSLNLTVSLPPVEGVFTAPLSALYGDNRLFKIQDERLQGIAVERLGSYYRDNEERLIFRSPKLQEGDVLVTSQLPNAVTGLKVRLNESSAETDAEEPAS